MNPLPPPHLARGFDCARPSLAAARSPSAICLPRFREVGGTGRFPSVAVGRRMQVGILNRFSLILRWPLRPQRVMCTFLRLIPGRSRLRLLVRQVLSKSPQVKQGIVHRQSIALSYLVINSYQMKNHPAGS